MLCNVRLINLKKKKTDQHKRITLAPTLNAYPPLNPINLGLTTICRWYIHIGELHISVGEAISYLRYLYPCYFLCIIIYINGALNLIFISFIFKFETLWPWCCSNLNINYILLRLKARNNGRYMSLWYRLWAGITPLSHDIRVVEKYKCCNYQHFGVK